MTTVYPLKHIKYVMSYLGILQETNRFEKKRAQECFTLDECKDVRKDWSKNKDKVTNNHWDILKEREMLIEGDMLLANLNALNKINTSRMSATTKKSHEKKIVEAQFKLTHFLHTSLRETVLKRLDSELGKMKKKMRKLGIFIPRKLR